MTPGSRLDAMRARAPLVHNITNYVAMNVMANVLLAVGASPAMIHAREEAAEFARIADALTVNIGTLSPAWVEAMAAAAEAARDADKPWVLDPVAAGATGYRTDVAAALIERQPSVVRGNASEILAVAGRAGAGQGVDAGDPVAVAEEAARTLARRTGGTVAVTGAIDFVTDGTRAARIANGHVTMPRVTALGCSLTGVIGAFVACEGDVFEQTAAALAFYAVAGERAGTDSDGPGSFAVRFLDALHGLDAAGLDAAARVTSS